MSEKRFLNCLMVEGAMLLILGLCVIIIPKLTTLSYGVMFAGALITYGLYKIINHIVNKNYGFSIVWGIIMGVFVVTTGVLLLLVPKISILWLIAMIGIYFILESLSSAVYSYYLKSRYNFWGSKIFTFIILFLIGLLIILGLPAMSFFLVTILSGIGMIIKGMSKLTVSLINIKNYNL